MAPAAAFPPHWPALQVYFAISIVLAFNFLGDGLRDATDPYSVA